MLPQARSSEACFPEVSKRTRPEVYRKIQPLELVLNWLEQEDSDLVKGLTYGFFALASLFITASFMSYLIS